MKTSDRSLLTGSIVEILSAIMQMDGWRTAIGENVFVGLSNIEEQEMPCCLVLPGADTPAEDAGPNGHVVVRYQIAGFLNRRDSIVPALTDNPGDEYAQIDAVIADIREAIEGDGCALTDTAESVAYAGATPLYQQRGGEACGATLEYLITTTFIDYMPGQ